MVVSSSLAVGDAHARGWRGRGSGGGGGGGVIGVREGGTRKERPVTERTTPVSGIRRGASTTTMLGEAW